MRYALTYGGIAGAIAIAVIFFSLVSGLPNHNHSMWFGYLVMLAALTLIFVGVKRYRDVECGGVIRFGRAFGIGLGMAVVAGLVYVALFEVFVAATGYDFMADYSHAILEGMRRDGASAAEIAAAQQEMHGFEDIFADPFKRLPMVFLEIFPVGLLVALVSAALLRNPRLLPARAAV
jgi:hypothetical protein